LPSSEEQRNQTAYDRIGPQWAAARNGFFGQERTFLDALLEGLPASSLILDAGCGAGRPMAEAVVARGHRVLGVDQSRVLLDLARQRLPGERWVLCPLTDYDFGGAGGERDAVRGIICWDALFHIPRQRHQELLRRMACRLAPGGRLMLTSGGSEHPPFTDEMFGEEFFYDSHPPQTLRSIVRGLGLQVLMDEFLNPPTTGRDKGRYALLAQKAGS